jgi:D-aspartate ligase
MNTTPAVVLSTHTIGLAVIRSLGVMGVPVHAAYYETKDMGYVSRYVVKAHKVAHPEHEESDFMDGLLAVSRTLDRKPLLIPADDPTLVTVSKNKLLLDEHYIVACPEWSITRKYIDKKYTYDLAEGEGVPVPRTLIPRSEQEVRTFSKEINYPCIVKPSRSHSYFELFRRKMLRVRDQDELLSAYQEAAEAGLEVFLQEWIPGDDTCGVNYNSFSINAEPLIEFTAEKVRLSPPEFGVPRVVKSKKVEEVIELGRATLRALGYDEGYACTEFKKDYRDGKYKLMELNGRHNRSSLLALKCGINFPWIEYQYLVNHRTTQASEYQEDVYWIDEFRDLLQSAKDFRTMKLSDLIKPYMNPRCFAVYDASDRKPFFKRIGDSFSVTRELLKKRKVSQIEQTVGKRYAK